VYPYIVYDADTPNRFDINRLHGCHSFYPTKQGKQGACVILLYLLTYFSFQGDVADPRLKACNLFLEIQRLGGRAIHGLIVSLLQTGHDKLGALLYEANKPPGNGLRPLDLRSEHSQDFLDCSPTEHHHHCLIPFPALTGPHLEKLPEYLTRQMGQTGSRFNAGKLYIIFLNL